MLALFLPFSCNERRQVGASASKQNKLEVIEEASKIGAYRESATTCKPLQNGSSKGSGPGGRWFESTRPDQPFSITSSLPESRQNSAVDDFVDRADSAAVIRS